MLLPAQCGMVLPAHVLWYPTTLAGTPANKTRAQERSVLLLRQITIPLRPQTYPPPRRSDAHIPLPKHCRYHSHMPSATTNPLRRRRDMTLRQSESWPPPRFPPPTTRHARIFAPLRRFFDLQAGSIWRDLKPELSQPHGVVLDVGCGAQPYR